MSQSLHGSSQSYLSTGGLQKIVSILLQFIQICCELSKFLLQLSEFSCIFHNFVDFRTLLSLSGLSRTFSILLQDLHFFWILYNFVDISNPSVCRELSQFCCRLLRFVVNPLNFVATLKFLLNFSSFCCRFEPFCLSGLSQFCLKPVSVLLQFTRKKRLD